MADLSGPYAAIFSPGDSNRVLVDNGSDALLEVNLGDGSKTLLSGLDASDGSRVGLGPTFRQIQSVILDPADSDRVYVHDGDGGSSGSGRIFSADLAAGDRIALEGSLGGGPEFISPVKVAFMPGVSPDHPPMAIVLDSAASDSFYGVSLAAGDNLGDRVALSGFDADSPNQPLGSGVDFENPRDLVVDVANNRLLVVDGSLSALVAVDLETGDRSILSDAGTGNGPPLDEEDVLSIALDAANNRALIATPDALLAVDLGTGDPSILPDTGAGFEFSYPSTLALALDSDSSRLLLMTVLDDGSSLRLDSVDLQSGNRTVITDNVVGSGPPVGLAGVRTP